MGEVTTGVVEVEHGPEVAGVRPGEELDWVALEASPAGRTAPPAGRVLGAAVPERLGQPDLPGPVRRRRPRGPAPALRCDRDRSPRHAPRVHRAVAAARGVPTGPAGRALLRRHRRHRRPLPRLRVPPGRGGLGPGARRAGGRRRARTPDRLRGRRRARRPAPGRAGGVRPRLPRPSRGLPGPAGPGLDPALGRGRDERARHRPPGRRAPCQAPARVRPRHASSTTTSRSTTASSPPATPTR